jgi:tetratricopeptide (TPR) repeat protein
VRDLLTAIGLVLALAISAGAGQSVDTPAALREAALAADARFDTPAALAALDQGLKRFPNDPGLLAAKGRIYWRLLRTKSAEQALVAAARSPRFSAEANYFLGRIYHFKGSQAEGAFPGFHEEVNYRPRATAAFAAAGTPAPEWVRAADAANAALTAADAAVAEASADPMALRNAIDARVRLRPDPMSYIAGANALLNRVADLPFVLRLAAEGRVEGERFIRENESSYKLDGKVRASLDRNQAVFADIAGWALFLQGDMTRAESRLAEAARLYRNVDVTNQLRLAELSRRKNDLETARDHYLTALGLAGIAPAQRAQAKTALADVQAKSGASPAEFDQWLADVLEQKRNERRRALVSNMQGHRLPALVLTDLQGNKVDLRAERGNVVLLNFFSAW